MAWEWATHIRIEPGRGRSEVHGGYRLEGRSAPSLGAREEKPATAGSGEQLAIKER